MESSPSHQQSVNGTPPPLEFVNKTQISFTDETTSDHPYEIQTNLDAETTTLHVQGESSSTAESSTNPNHLRSTIAKSRRSTNLQPTISKIDEEAAGPKEHEQHLQSQCNSPPRTISLTLMTGDESSTNSSALSVNSYYLIEDRSYIREKRFHGSEGLNLPSNQIFAIVGVIKDWMWKFIIFVCKDWTLEQLINNIKANLRPHQNVKRLLYENYDLDIFVPIRSDEDFKECIEVSKVMINFMVDPGDYHENK